jgi:hypothetical protein
MIETAYNLKGEPIGPRNRDGPTEVGAHYGNCDAEGNYVVDKLPTESDWFYQSFCSSHLEQTHQVRIDWQILELHLAGQECTRAHSHCLSSFFKVG